MIECYECEQTVPDSASSCPKCGAKLIESVWDMFLPRPKDSKVRINWPARAGIATIFGCVALYFFAFY